MDFNLEIGESNKIQIKELLRIIDKIKYDNIKNLYYASQVVETDKNIFLYMKFYNTSKEILENTLKNNYISYTNLQKLSVMLNFIFIIEATSSYVSINPIIRRLIYFYLYNFLFDIDYILQKKLKPEIDFTGVDVTAGIAVHGDPNGAFRQTKIKIKSYLSKYTYTELSNEEKQNIIDYEKSLLKKLELPPKENFLIPHHFLISNNIETFKHSLNQKITNVTSFDVLHDYEAKNKIGYHTGLYLNLLSLEEQTPILNEIYSDIKKIFDKKLKNEEYSIAIQEIIQSERTINHLELYEKLNGYLESFGNKEELTKLNNKYKSYLDFEIIKEKLLKIYDILSKVLAKIPDENENFKNIIVFMKDYLISTYIENQSNIIRIDHWQNSLLFALEEIRNLYQPSYFDINSNKPIENLDFIINTIHELYDYFINYININYISIKNDMPTLSGLNIKFGGTINRNKKTLKKYK